MGGDPRLLPGSFGGALRLSDVGPTLLGLLDLPALDPAAGAGLDSMEAGLRARVLGEDHSASLVNVENESCTSPRLLAEGMFYGPSRTRLLDVDGRDIQRNDETQEIKVASRCGGKLAPLSDREKTWLLELDLWRARSEARSPRVLDDPELDRQLRALGYLR